MKRILCLQLPEWPLQRLLAARPELRPFNSLPCPPAPRGGNAPPKNSGKQCYILLHIRAPRRGLCVAACSPAARLCGVRPGITLTEASALVQRRGRLHVEPYDAAADHAARAQLAELCERFSPLVGWETAQGKMTAASRRTDEAPSPAAGVFPFHHGSLFLDITGIGRLFGGEPALAAKIHRELARQGYAPCIAVAETAGAAWAGANYALRPDDDKPWLILTPSDVAETLAPLPLAALRVAEETISLLAAVGVQTIGELRQLPRASLTSRFGERLLQRLDQAFGDAPETIVPHRPAPQYEAQCLLEYPLEGRAALDQLIMQLVERVSLDLKQQQEGVVRMHCRLDCAPGRPLTMEVGLFRPTATPQHLWELLRMQLDQTRLPGPVGRIGLEALLTAPLEQEQAELFAGGAQQTNRQLGLLIDRLSSRLGTAAVVRPSLRADPLPERAFRYAPCAGQKPGSPPRASKRTKTKALPKQNAASADNDDSARPAKPSFRPLQLIHPPQPLEVVAIAPDGPPISFRWQGKSYRVARHWGPERIETAWWRTRTIRRDYYRVETTTGQRLWLFRELHQWGWYLQGAFA